MVKSSFGFKNPEDSPGFLLWQTTMAWQRLLKNALEPYDISHAQFVILAVVLWFEETRQSPIQSAIVNKTKLDKMTVSKSLKKLAVEGLIERNEHAHDTRAKSVYLTGKGKTLIKKLVPIVEGIDHEFFGAIKKGEQRLLIQFLCCLVNERLGNALMFDKL